MGICLTSGTFDLSDKLSCETIYYRTFLIFNLSQITCYWALLETEYWNEESNNMLLV